MKSKDLIQGCWYKLTYSEYKLSDYFKFEKIENDKIYSYAFYIAPSDIEPYIEYNKFYCDISYIDDSKNTELYNVDISEVLKYLPDDNIDKINYLRKQRIKLLLMYCFTVSL